MASRMAAMSAKPKLFFANSSVSSGSLRSTRRLRVTSILATTGSGASSPSAGAGWGISKEISFWSPGFIPTRPSSNASGMEPMPSL